MENNLDKNNKIIFYTVIMSIFLIISVLSFFIYKKNKIVELNSVEISKDSLVIVNSDQQKILEIAKGVIKDPLKTPLQKETASLFYAKNASDLTPVGLSTERKKNFIESYINLYNIGINGIESKNKVKALLSFEYVYRESCSVDDWFIEAVGLFDNEMLMRNQKNTDNKKIVVHRILSELLSSALKESNDKAIVVTLAEVNIELAILENISKDNFSKISLDNINSIYKVKESTSTLDTSLFAKLDIDRKMLSVIISSENSGVNTGVNVGQEYEKQIQNTEKSFPSEGAYVNEYSLRYLYASYLWSKGGKSNITKIKEVLDITFTEDKVKNAPGWIYGISLAENNILFQYLKPLSKEYPELASFLKKHGWKNV